MPNENNTRPQNDEFWNSMYEDSHGPQTYNPPPVQLAECLPATELMVTPNGLKYVAEVRQDAGLTCSHNGPKRDIAYHLFDENGSGTTTTSFSANGNRPVFRLETRTGNILSATARHQVMMMNTQGFEVNRTMEQIAVGDYCVSIRKYDQPIGFPSGRDANDLYAMGALIADGTFGIRRMFFTNNDPVVIAKVVPAWEALLGVDAKEYENPKSPGSWNFHFNTKSGVQKLYSEVGWGPDKAATKHLGLFIRTLCAEEFAEVLRGYVDCECSITESSIDIVSASCKLLFEVKTAMQAHWGILSSINVSHNKEYDRDYYRLSMFGAEARKYAAEIGFHSAVRNEEKAKLFTTTVTNPNIDVYPHLSGLVASLHESTDASVDHNRAVRDCKTGGHNPGRNTLKHMLSLPWHDGIPLKRLQEVYDRNYFYDEVVSITRTESQLTYDFRTPSRSYVTANIVTHSCTR